MDVGEPVTLTMTVLVCGIEELRSVMMERYVSSVRGL